MAAFPFLFFPYFGLEHFFGRMLLVGNTIFHLGITQKDEAVQGTTKY